MKVLMPGQLKFGEVFYYPGLGPITICWANDKKVCFDVMFPKKSVPPYPGAKIKLAYAKRHIVNRLNFLPSQRLGHIDDNSEALWKTLYT